MHKPRRRRKIVLCALAVVLVLVAILLYEPKRPPVVRLTVPEGWPSSTKVSLADRIARLKPMWLLRLQSQLFGPRRQVILESTLVEISERSAVELAELPSNPPAWQDTNGLRVWIVHTNAGWKGIGERLSESAGRNQMRPRIQTSDGVQATLSVQQPMTNGGVPVLTGWVVGMLPRLQKASIDLSVTLMHTDLETDPASSNGSSRSSHLHTNGPVAARIQLTNGCGVLMIYDGGRRLGVLLHPAKFPAK